MTHSPQKYHELCGSKQSIIIPLPLYQRRETAVFRADAAEVPVDHEVTPDYRLRVYPQIKRYAIMAVKGGGKDGEKELQVVDNIR